MGEQRTARREAPDDVGATGGQSAKLSKGETAFRGHLMIYLVTGLFLLTLNLLTSPGELWFYWPLFFWGWALIFQAVATFGADAPRRVIEALRSIVPGLGGAALARPRPVAPIANAKPFPATALAAADERIQRLWRIAEQIPTEAVRDQAFRICAAADRIAAAMAADRTDAETVAWFNDRLLEPTETLFSRYLRLTSRGIASADETLRRVESQNLPLIESRLDTLYQQLHRGDVVDLAVASEMLELELPDEPPATRRTLQ
jgi:hypothetical protein